MRFLILALTLFAAGPNDVKTSEQKLRLAMASGQRKQLTPAVQELAGWNNADAMKAILRIVAAGPNGVEPSIWMEAYPLLLRAAAGMNHAAALQEAAEYIVEHKTAAVSRDLLAMLCNQGRPEIVPPVVIVLEKGADDMRVVAAEHLVTIGDKRAIDALIGALKDSKASPELKRRAAQALASITGQSYGDSATNWEGWWTANKDAALKTRAETDRGSGTVTMDPGRGTEWEELKKNAKVLVLGAGKKCKCGGDHDLDHIDATCRKLGLEVVFIDKIAFEKDDFDPTGYLAILANCTMIREHCTCPQCKPSKTYSGDRLFECECPINKHDPWSYVMGDKGAKKIRKYVEGGGYLFAEDWCMEDFVEKAFGDFVRHGSVRPNDEEIPVVPAMGAMTHPYLKKIFFRGWKPKANGSGTVSEDELKEVVHTWKIDKETRTIKIVDPKRVVTMLQSPFLEKYASGDDAVAITFLVGAKDGRPPVATTGEIQQDREKMSGGRVIYVLSHFGKQKSEDDEFSLQNLLINFLVEAYARKTAKKK